MSDFVRDHAFDARGDVETNAHLVVTPRIEKIIGENDRARVFHAAEASRTDDQRELLVRVGCDRLTEK